MQPDVIKYWDVNSFHRLVILFKNKESCFKMYPYLTLDILLWFYYFCGFHQLLFAPN